MYWLSPLPQMNGSAFNTVSHLELFPPHTLFLEIFKNQYIESCLILFNGCIMLVRIKNNYHCFNFKSIFKHQKIRKNVILV